MTYDEYMSKLDEALEPIRRRFEEDDAPPCYCGDGPHDCGY